MSELSPFDWQPLTLPPAVMAGLREKSVLCVGLIKFDRQWGPRRSLLARRESARRADKRLRQNDDDRRCRGERNTIPDGRGTAAGDLLATNTGSPVGHLSPHPHCGEPNDSDQADSGETQGVGPGYAGIAV